MGRIDTESAPLLPQDVRRDPPPKFPLPLFPESLWPYLELARVEKVEQVQTTGYRDLADTQLAYRFHSHVLALWYVNLERSILVCTSRSNYSPSLGSHHGGLSHADAFARLLAERT